MNDVQRSSQDSLFIQNYISPEDSLREVKKFFFRAMLRGYVSPDAGKTVIPGMPGYKSVIIDEGEFRLVDAWCVNDAEDLNSPASVGITTIFWNEKPVWYMNYSGRYTEGAISLLKRALEHAYQERVFLGGRGMSRAENGLIYINNPRVNDFAKFCGREDITDEKRNSLGFHEYWGRSLLLNC